MRSELIDTKVGVTIAFPGAIAANMAANSGMAAMTSNSSSSAFPTTAADLAAKLIYKQMGALFK